MIVAALYGWLATIQAWRGGERKAALPARSDCSTTSSSVSRVRSDLSAQCCPVVARSGAQAFVRIHFFRSVAVPGNNLLTKRFVVFHLFCLPDSKSAGT